MPIVPVIQSHKYKFSAGKQSAFGTPVANPDYQTPAYTADVGPQEDRTEIDVIQGSAYSQVAQLKTATSAGGEIEWAALAASLPRFLAMHFGTASDTVTGAGDPWTHTFARKDTPLPHTVWVGRPVAGGTFEYDKLVDCVAKTLEINYSQGQLLHVKSTLIGGSSVGVATAPTPGTIETITPALYGFTWRGATLNLDVDVTPAVTAVTTIKNFTITSDYPDAAMQFYENLAPDAISMGRYNLGFSASFDLPNWQMYNATFYGAKSPSANAAQSPTVLSGSIAFTIQQEPVSANRTLVITIPAMDFTLARPTPDSGGGPITATLAGMLQDPGTGVEPITVAVKSAVSTTFS